MPTRMGMQSRFAARNNPFPLERLIMDAFRPT